MKEIIRDDGIRHELRHHCGNHGAQRGLADRGGGWRRAARICEGVNMIFACRRCRSTSSILWTRWSGCSGESRSVVIAVSEGVKLADGRYVCELSDDAALRGRIRPQESDRHGALSGQSVAGKLKTKTRSIAPACAAHVSSRTDITEAYQVGGAAAKGRRLRDTRARWSRLSAFPNDPYQCTTRLVDIHQIANFRKEGAAGGRNSYRTDMETGVPAICATADSGGADPGVYRRPAETYFYEIATIVQKANPAQNAGAAMHAPTGTAIQYTVTFFPTQGAHCAPVELPQSASLPAPSKRELFLA